MQVPVVIFVLLSAPVYEASERLISGDPALQISERIHGTPPYMDLEVQVRAGG